MGWSCRKDAMDTFQKITKVLCIGNIQNEYRIKDTTYMIEISSREHEDGAITGQIFNLSEWSGRPCNSFRISPEGKVERGPKCFFMAANDETISNLGVPQEK